MNPYAGLEIECFRPGGLELTRRLLEQAALPPRASILDCGCGRGASVELIKSMGYNAEGFDSDFPWEGTCRDFRNISYESHSFDCLIFECSLSIFLETDEARALALIDLLKPEGVVLVSDMIYEKGLTPEYYDRFFLKNRLTCQWYSDEIAALKAFRSRWIWENERPFPDKCAAKGAGYFAAVYRR